ncbi:MAG: hypothetical protein E7138_05630 [Rikenellaceae bacterium]|nr:hypothetical protein [Rikenellaceae bacterium]MBR6630494.1 hypothetical protein [Alistipes sp.]
MQEKTVLSIIIDFIFGHKYYANIINTRGVEKYELSCFIFRTRGAADLHRRDIESTTTFAYVETISFRSRRNYPPAQRINR